MPVYLWILISAIVCLGSCCARVPSMPVCPPLSKVMLSESELDLGGLQVAYGQVAEAARCYSATNVDRLLELARHQDYLVRIRAVHALGEPLFISNALALAELRTHLDDPHWIVRATAAKGLGRVYEPWVAGALRERLVRESHSKVREILERRLGVPGG